MKTMFKVKVCLLMLLCSVAAAMANPPVPVEKVKGTNPLSELLLLRKEQLMVP